MDIVLTIPKQNYERSNRNLRAYLDDGGCIFWTMSRVAKNLIIGDRVHFVKYGRVEHSMRLFKIKERASEIDVSTGERHSARYILYMDDLQYHDEIIAVRGFQGFRYKWWKESCEGCANDIT